MKRWLIWLAMLALWSASQCRLAHADEAALQPAALSIAALPAGVDPAAETVTAGRLDAGFQPVQHDALRFAMGEAARCAKWGCTMVYLLALIIRMAGSWERS